MPNYYWTKKEAYWNVNKSRNRGETSTNSVHQ